MPQQTPPIMHQGSPLLTPYEDDWADANRTKSTTHASAANLSSVFGSDMSPIPHGLPDVSESAQPEPESPPKAGQGASDDEEMMDDDKESSKRPYMPFDRDLCDLSDHDSDVEAPSCKERGARVGPEVRSGPSREAKKARVDDSIKDAQESLTNESIGKFLAHDCDCGEDCTRFINRDHTYRWRAATYDFIQQGPVAEHALKLMDAIKVANPKTRKDLKEDSKKFEYKLDNRLVCEQTFRLAHGLSHNVMKRGRQASYKDLESVPKKQKTGKAVNDRDSKGPKYRQDSEKREQTVVWMKGWVGHHGCLQPDSEIVYIDDVPMDDMWKEYCEEMRDVIKPLESRQFRRVWQNNMTSFCHKRRRKPFGTCGECTGYKARIHKFARDKNELLIVKKEYFEHLDMQKEERGVYYHHRLKGLRGEGVSMMVDGMDQSKLVVPHTMVPPKDASNRLETKITGVLVHGKRFDAYISEPQVPSDSNLNLTCIHTTLMKLKRDAPGGVLPRKFYLQVDGGSENKNKWMISYLSLLVEVGMFDYIKMSYLPVGHTHEDIDQAFSRIAVYLNRHDAIDMDEFIHAVRESFVKDEKKPYVSIIGAAFDFKDFLKDRLPDMKGWTDNLCYRFAKNLVSGDVEMHYKFFGKSPHYFGAFHDEKVASFKKLASLATGSQEDMNLYCRKKGIDMPKGVPTGEPGIAKVHDFSVSEDCDKTSSTQDR